MYFFEVVKGLSDTTFLTIFGLSLAIAFAVVYKSESAFSKLSHITKLIIVFLASISYFLIILLIFTFISYLMKK